MNKMLAGSMAAMLMAAGAVSVTMATADAAPYPGTVKTNTSVSAPDTVDRFDKARICATVDTAGNASPKGHVIFTVSRDAGGYSFSDEKFYDGGKVCTTTDKLGKRGDYSVKAKFDAKDGSVFKNSSDTTSFRVVRR